jgi:hypothetical protein
MASDVAGTQGASTSQLLLRELKKPPERYTAKFAQRRAA